MNRLRIGGCCSTVRYSRLIRSRLVGSLLIGCFSWIRYLSFHIEYNNNNNNTTRSPILLLQLQSQDDHRSSCTSYRNGSTRTGHTHRRCCPSSCSYRCSLQHFIDAILCECGICPQSHGGPLSPDNDKQADTSHTSWLFLPFDQKPTTSEEASKADLHHKHSTHEDLQSHTVRSHAEERRADKVTASPNEAPTESEDVAHALRGDQGNHDDPKTLQEKTVKKASGNHH